MANCSFLRTVGSYLITSYLLFVAYEHYMITVSGKSEVVPLIKSHTSSKGQIFDDREISFALLIIVYLFGVASVFRDKSIVYKLLAVLMYFILEAIPMINIFMAIKKASNLKSSNSIDLALSLFNTVGNLNKLTILGAILVK